MQTRIVLHGRNEKEILNGLNRNLSKSNARVRQIQTGAECVFEDSTDVRKAVDRTVREYIVKFMEPIEVKKIINQGYDFFDGCDKKALANAVQNAIAGEENIRDKLFVMRRNRIIESVSENYFKENSYLNLEGFLPFRLQRYHNELEEMVEYNAEVYMIQKEYDEFIWLLKSYLSEQPKTMCCINIVVAENGEYIFCDGMGRNITKKLSKEIPTDCGNREDDLIVNVLVGKNPSKIVIHNSRYMKKEILKTIKLIFGDSCSVCEGCGLCKY